MRVIAGTLKGKQIPFVNKKFDRAEATPQKVKEAMFSIIGGGVAGSRFLDLYACSGQIGIEALSRGASYIVMNESDQARFRFIRSLTENWGIGETAIALNMLAPTCMRFLRSKEMRFDYIFIDPPYEKKSGATLFYDGIITLIEKYGIANEKACVIVQHYSKNILNESPGGFILDSTRKYGTTSLSFYSLR
jgi:16S rRNA (guanine966-N2)-methyltransferase